MKNMRKGNFASRGYTLIEVLIGILIFAVGMMALAQLQGNLAQNSGDANARTVATNIAESVIEQARSFSIITSDGTNHAYNDISGGTSTVDKSGARFLVNTAVTDYYYQPDGSFDTAVPTGAASSQFKKLEITVTWNDADDGREFYVDQDTTTTGGLGSGSITLTEIVSSIPSGANGKAALGDASMSMYAPPVDYSPGENPDIISINLGHNKFKESTTPLPDVLRADELVETRFDVVTYSNPVVGGATFLRREEFRAVSCECTLKVPSGNPGDGLRPTVWEGTDYTEGEWVSKPYGVSASNQQSEFCDICCRDHHDGGSGTNDIGTDSGKSLYSPFRAATEYHTEGGLAGDHKHYSRNSSGHIQVADTDGARYVEACRLVRKDGFFRVAQDLRQEGLNSFPADFLDEAPEIDVYSGYVTAAVKKFEFDMGVDRQYEFTPPLFKKPGDMSPPLTFPASTYGTATEMSNYTGVTEQQLRARGLYVDYMTDELRRKINCLDDGGTGEACDVPQVSTALEIIPFYDVQLTWLARWNEIPSNYPIDVSNQAIANDNAHSRGIAKITEGDGDSRISTAVHNGNLGLTGTDPIDPYYLSDEEKYVLYATVVDFSSPPPLSGVRITGSILSAVNGLKAADVEIAAEGAQCDRTNIGFECVVESEAKKPVLRVFNYDKAGKLVYACSAELALQPPHEHISLNGSGSWTNLSLNVSTNVVTDIVIKEGGC